MDENEQATEQDEATETTGQADEGRKSDVAQEIENDPSANPDEEHLKDMKGA